MAEQIDLNTVHAAMALAAYCVYVSIRYIMTGR
jgi:hypothetical protein